MNRRALLQGATALSTAAVLARFPHARASTVSPPELSLRIEPCVLEIGPGIHISTVAYNGQVPGPLLRLRRGKPVAIDVTNVTARPDLVHWHGLRTDPLNDGASEEGSPLIQPGETLRYQLTPEPSGTRWYHSHASAMDDLTASTYSGRFGFLLVDGAPDSGRCDQEVHLAIHHWGGHFVPMVETMRAPLEQVAVDFLADNPGDSLLHCHQQLHMDYGLCKLLNIHAEVCDL